MNDGDMSTRWGSSFEDGAYIQIDLEGSYIINRFKLFWEALMLLLTGLTYL